MPFLHSVPDLVPDFVNSLTFRVFCREEGIRTLDTVTRILPFQGSLFNHSSTSLFGFANVMDFLKFKTVFKLLAVNC